MSIAHLGKSNAGMEVNVSITRRDADTGRVIDRIEKHNMVTKMALFGIARFINGEFNETTPERQYNYQPRYLALGTNRAGALNPGVTAEVTVNDSKLLHELSPRLTVPQSNIIENREQNNYIQFPIQVYIPVDLFVGESIGEAGLFTHDSGNNLWARVAFTPFTKGTNEVIDVTWTISIVSVGTTIYPESITVLPATYTFTDILDRAQLRAVFQPAGTTMGDVIWSSTDESVATVNNFGVVTPIANGTCRILGTAVNDLVGYSDITVNI